MSPNSPSDDLRRARNRAGQIRKRRWTRLANTLTWQERRAIYLLESGKLEIYRAEFPDGAPRGSA